MRLPDQVEEVKSRNERESKVRQNSLAKEFAHSGRFPLRTRREAALGTETEARTRKRDVFVTRST